MIGVFMQIERRQKWFPRGNGSVGVVGVVAAEGGAAEGGAVEGRLANLK